MRSYHLRLLCLHASALLWLFGGVLQDGYGAVEMTSLSTSNSAEVSFTWKANAEPDLAGYKLYIGNQSRIYSSSVNVGLTTTFRLAGLVPGTTYFFALTAYNTNGIESLFSNELMYQAPELPTNSPPALNSLPDLVLLEDSSPYLVPLTGISPGGSDEVQTLTISTSSSDPGLIPVPVVNYSSPNSTGSLVIQPRPDAFGIAVITVTVDDGQLENSRTSRSFTVTVQPVNDRPYFDPLPDITIEQDTTDYLVPLQGIHSGAVNEQDALAISMASSRFDLVPIPTLIYTSPNSTALLVVGSVPGVTGSAVITVTLSDGQSSFSRTFSVLVQAVNSPPAISQIADQSIPKNRPTNPIPFTVSDQETPGTQLQLSAASSNPSVIPISGLILGGLGNNRTLIIDPTNGRSGMSMVTVTVNDGSSTTAMSFQVTVDVPDPITLPQLTPIE
jgi:hypothetical protein